MPCASSSLPVPVSPSSSTVLSVCATRRAWRLISSAAALVPMKLAIVYFGRRCAGELLARLAELALRAARTW